MLYSDMLLLALPYIVYLGSGCQQALCVGVSVWWFTYGLVRALEFLAATRVPDLRGQYVGRNYFYRQV